LLVHGANPVQTLPSSIGFADALARVPFVVSFANTPDETSEYAGLILPDHHFLESWGDYSPRSGVVNLLQPAAAPLLHSRATGDVLISVARQIDAETAAQLPAGSWQEYARSWWLRHETNLVNPQPSNATTLESSQEAWSKAQRTGGRF